MNVNQPRERTEGTPVSRRRSALVGHVRDLARRHRLLLDRLSRAEELADALAQELSELEETLLNDSDALVIERKATNALKKTLRRAAEAGVTSLDMKARADGSAEVRIDGSKWFTLPPTLADLLSILACDNGTTEDGLIGWTSLDDVRLRLGKRIGKDVRPHTLAQHIYRLRQEISVRGGANRFLVQSHRRRGFRFALRRKVAPVIESERR